MRTMKASHSLVCRSSNEWEAFVRLLSSDRAILDVLLRGARRREAVSLLDPTPAQRAEAWREAVQEVVVEAFADEGVVRLLTKKMQLCEEQSQRASKRSGRSRKKARSASKGAGKAPRATTAGTVLKAPSPLEAKTTSRSSTGMVNRETSRSIIGEELPRSSSARLLGEKNARALPFDPDAGGNGAQQRSHARGCNEPRTPTFAVDSNAKSAAPVPPGPEMGKREDDVDATRARVAVLEDAGGVYLDHQKTPAIIRDKASGDNAKTRHAIPDAAPRVTDEARGETKACPPPLQVMCKDRPPSPCIDVGDGLGTRARSGRDEDVLSKQPNTSDDEGATAVLSGSNEDCPHVLSTQSDHRAAGCWSSPPATTAETTGAKTGGAGATEPPSSVGVESVQSLARAEASTAAATPSPTGVLVDRHHASVGEGELGSLLSTLERQVERGAELVRHFEQAAKPRLALDDDDDVKAERGDNGKPDSGNTDLSTMTPSSTSSEEKTFSKNCNMATNVAGIAVATEQQSIPELVTIGAIPREADTGSDREPERTEKNSNTEDALLYLGGVPEQPSTGGEGATNRSLPVLGEQPSLPDTNTTLDEDNEEYEFTFDDEEMAVGGGQKSVQFTDESRWSTHEVRACFEQHELGELFYTTAELDSMLEEAESEEALERSSALLSQGEEILGDTAVAAGEGSGSLLFVGGNQAPKRRASSGAEEIVSFEKVSFDDEDSDYDF